MLDRPGSRCRSRRRDRSGLSCFNVVIGSSLVAFAALTTDDGFRRIRATCRGFVLPADRDAIVDDRGRNIKDAPRSGRRILVGSALVAPAIALPRPSAAEGLEEEEVVPAKAFDITFDVDFGVENPSGKQIQSFTARFYPEWAPLGVARFAKLARMGWYDDSYVHRVIPNFIAQFGLPAKFTQQIDPIEDDTRKVSNKRGTIVMANSGPNSRCSQVFINLKDNGQYLDGGSGNFAPIGEIEEGMEIVDKFFSGYDEGPNQGMIAARGNKYLETKFPRLTKIRGLYQGFTRNKFGINLPKYES